MCLAVLATRHFYLQKISTRSSASEYSLSLVHVVPVACDGELLPDPCQDRNKDKATRHPASRDRITSSNPNCNGQSDPDALRGCTLSYLFYTASSQIQKHFVLSW